MAITAWRRLAFTLAALVMGTGVGAEESVSSLEALRAKGVVEIAVYAEYPPSSAGNGGSGASGIDVELAGAIANELRLKLKLRMVNADENASDNLRNHVWKGHYLGVAGLMLHVGYDPTFAKHEPNVVLCAPVFHDSLLIAYNSSRIRHLDSPIALTEHKIGVEGDTISDHILSSACGGALRTSTVRKASLADAVNDLGDGRVDGVVGPQGELQGLQAGHPLPDNAFRPQQPVGLMRTSSYVGVAIKNTGEPSLRDAVYQAVGTLKANGSLQKIYRAHGVVYRDAAVAATPESKT